MTERAVVRAHLMRNTVHLVDAADYVRFRPLYQPLLGRHLAGNFGRRTSSASTWPSSPRPRRTCSARPR